MMLKAIKKGMEFRYSYWWFLLANYKRRVCKNKPTTDQRIAIEEYEQGIALYNQTDSALVKTKWQIFKDLNRLMKYWHCYPDVYFRMGMFLTGYTDWSQIISFLPQIAFVRYERQWEQYPEYAFLLENKIIFNDYLTYNGIPVSKVLFFYKNRRFFTKGGKELSDETLNSILVEFKTNSIFVKKATGSCGKGITVFTKNQNNNYTLNGLLVDASFIRDLCGKEDYLFEERLSQNNILSQFCPDTINTIRVVTINNSGDECIIIGASIRFGRIGGYVDNLSQGGISVNLDIQTGELFEFGMRKYDLTKYYEHPDTKVRFAHVVIPQWSEVKDLVYHVCSLLPPFREIGWDIALTLDGPVIVELNTGTGISSVQMGPKYGVASFFKDSIPHFTNEA